MNALKQYSKALLLSLMLAQPLLAAPVQPEAGPAAGGRVDAVFAGPEPVDYTLLDQQGIEETTGEVAFLVAAIVGIDRALMSFFWGVYVPHYAPVMTHSLP